MAKEWFTVKECLGLPGFPGSEPAVRERLYKYSEGKEGVRRKRVKSKAEEFHISVFPLYVHRYLDDSGEEPTPEPISLQEAEPEDIQEMMFRLLTPEQRKQVTGRFKVRGMKAVFPFLFNDTPGVLEILCHSSNIQSKRNDTCPSPSISIKRLRHSSPARH